MVRKTILVVANSWKHFPSRCIAGRELVIQSGVVTPGPWIRPVTNHGEGEISPVESRLPDGSQPAVGDVVDVPLKEHLARADQPENWLLERGVPWQRSPLAGWPLTRLVEIPGDLWLEPGQRKHDRISAAYVAEHPPKASLYLIRPDSIHLELDVFPDVVRPKPGYKVVFRYRGIPYWLKLTDPLAVHRYFDPIQDRTKPVPRIDLACGNSCLLCVSLGGEWEGNHYKLVATIIENPK